MSTPSRGLRFGINIAWNVMGQGGLVLISFFLVPFLIKKLGLSGYALYGYMGILSGYLALCALGANAATVKYIAEYTGSDDRRSFGETLGSSLALNLIGVILGAGLLVSMRSTVVDRFLQVEPGQYANAVWIVACAGIAAIFQSVTRFGISTMQGMQRFAPSSLTMLLQPGLMLTGSALFLVLGYSLQELGSWYVFLEACLAVGVFLFVFRMVQEPSGGRPFRFPSANNLNLFFKFSTHVFVGQVAWAVVFQWDKFFIGYFLPVHQITYYLVPSFLLQKFWILPGSVANVAFPLLSEMSGTGDVSAMSRVYRLCSQIILWIIIPPFVILALFAPQFLTLWLGSEFSIHGVWPLRWLVFGYLFHLLAIMPCNAAYGTGKPQYVVVWSVAQAVVCLACWPVLIPRLGITGAAFGFFISQALTGLPYTVLVSRRVFKLRFLEYVSGVALRPFAAGVLLLTLLFPFREVTYGWVGLVTISLAGVAIFYLVAFKILGSEEREALDRLIAGMLKRLRSSS